MEIGSASSSPAPSNSAQVKVFNSERKQTEAVTATILEGVEESAHTAQKIASQNRLDLYV